MKYSKEEKEEFIKKMKAKTKQFAIDAIKFCDTLPKTQAYRTISFQLIKSATSTGANYRAACRGRSKAEFHSKISITVEEADESQYWLELIEGSETLCNKEELSRLLKEIGEILAVVTKARYNRLYSEIICMKLNRLFSLPFVGQIIPMRQHNSYLTALISKKIPISIHYKLFQNKV